MGTRIEGFISQDDTEAVLKKVMDDGSFDKMRHKVIDQIKQNVCPSRVSAADGLCHLSLL